MSEPTKAERYDQLRDAGKTHEQAVAQVEQEFAQRPVQEPSVAPPAPTSAATPRPKPIGGVKGMLGELAQGATLGFAGRTGLVNPAEMRQFEQENPFWGPAANVAGSLAIPGGLLAKGGKALLGAAELSPAIRAALSTGGAGALGAVEGGNLAPEGQRNRGAAMGGLAGLLAGGGVTAGTAALGKAGRVIKNIAGRGASQEGTDQLLSEMLTRTGQKPEQAVQRVAQLRKAGVPQVSVGESMGPAGPLAVKQMGPLGPEAGGEAFVHGQNLLDTAKDRVTAPEVTQRYAQAMQAGGLPIGPKGTEALTFLRAKLPKLDQEMVKYIEDKGIPWDRMIDPNGDFTLEYLDLLKKNIDAKIYGKAVSTKAKDVSWIKLNRGDVEKAQAELVSAIDDAVQAKTGANTYAEARGLAGKNLEAQQALEDTRTGLGKSLQSAASAPPKGTGSNLSYGASAAAAGRKGIGLTELFEGLIGPGGQRTARKQAEQTLAAITRYDPEALWAELLQRNKGRATSANRNSILKAALGGGIGGQFGGTEP